MELEVRQLPVQLQPGISVELTPLQAHVMAAALTEFIEGDQNDR